MPLRLVPSFIFFCFVQSVTPGPANLASLAAALEYGRGAALRQWWGIFTGFSLISLASTVIAWFLGTALGPFVTWFSWLGSGYLLYLAWHMVRPLWEKGQEEKEVQKKKVSFLSGILVQMTNVKIMVFCMTALSSYVLPYTTDYPPLLLTGILLSVTCPLCNFPWLFAGVRLQSMFQEHQSAIRTIMALSLVYCAVRLHI